MKKQYIFFVFAAILIAFVLLFVKVASSSVVNSDFSANVSDSTEPIAFKLYEPVVVKESNVCEIKFDIPFTKGTEAGILVVIKVYDQANNETAVLVNIDKQVGRHSVKWNISEVPAGIYFCRMAAGEFKASQKIVVTK